MHRLLSQQPPTFTEIRNPRCPRDAARDTQSYLLLLPFERTKPGMYWSRPESFYNVGKSLRHKLRSSSSTASLSLAGTKSSFSPAGLGFSLAQLSVEISLTADKSSVEMPYDAALMVEEPSPNSHSRDFLVVSAPIKDWLGCGKIVIPIQGGHSEQEQDSIQYSPLLNVDIAADWKNSWLFLWEYIPGSILRSRAKMN